MRGTSGAAPATSRCTPQLASRAPAAPPARARITLSTSAWRMSRQRGAPSAARTANSRSRDAARASIRLATLAQAMSSTSDTAPKTIRMVRREPPTTCSLSGTTVAPHPVSKAGSSDSSWRAMRDISVWARSTVTPSLSRPSAIA